MRPPRLLVPAVLDDAVRGALESTADLLRSLGHGVGERAPEFGLVGNGFSLLYLHGIHEDVQAVPHPERLEPRTRGFGRIGGLVASRSVRRAVEAIPKHADRINRVFDDHDVVLMPTMGVPRSRSGAGRGGGRCAPCSG